MVIYTKAHSTYQNCASLFIKCVHVFLCSRKHEYKSILCNIKFLFYNTSLYWHPFTRKNKTKYQVSAHTESSGANEHKKTSINYSNHEFDWFLYKNLPFSLLLHYWRRQTLVWYTHTKRIRVIQKLHDSSLIWHGIPTRYAYTVGKKWCHHQFSMNLFFYYSPFFHDGYKFYVSRVKRYGLLYGNDVNVSVYCTLILIKWW